MLLKAHQISERLTTLNINFVESDVHGGIVRKDISLDIWKSTPSNFMGHPVLFHRLLLEKKVLSCFIGSSLEKALSCFISYLEKPCLVSYVI